MTEETLASPRGAPQDLASARASERRRSATGTWVVLGGAVLLDLGDPTDLQVYRRLTAPSPASSTGAP